MKNRKLVLSFVALAGLSSLSSQAQTNNTEKPSASCVGVVVDATDKTSAKASNTRAIATVLL